MQSFLVHSSKDNVGVAVVDIKASQNVEGKALDDGHSLQVTALQDVPLGHKIALRDIKAGDTVAEIRPGYRPRRRRHRQRTPRPCPQPENQEVVTMEPIPHFMGFRRENGRVGIRNHVVILPLDDISNAAAEAVGATTSRAPWRCRTPMAGCSSARTWTCTSAR